MLKANDLAAGTVASRPEQMYAWPGLTRVTRNELLAVASERKHHVCPFGRVVVIRSTDGGKTWGLPQEIHNSELDDRDSTILTFADGTLAAAWWTSPMWMNPPAFREEWQARRERATRKMMEELSGDWLIRSSDGGHTWEDTPHRIPDGGAAHSDPHVLSDGSLVCFGYQEQHDGLGMFFYRSEDRGETWTKLGEVPCRKTGMFDWYWQLGRGRPVPGPCVNERSLLELSPGNYLAMFRSWGMGDRLAQSRSENGGRTWTEPELTSIVGKPPHLLKLSSGAILCSYGHRADPWSIRAVLSYDQGSTWDTENTITIDQWEDHPDIGYPVSLEVNPSEILTVYYCSRRPLTHLPDQESTFKRRSTPEGLLFKKYVLQ